MIIIYYFYINYIKDGLFIKTSGGNIGIGHNTNAFFIDYDNVREQYAPQLNREPRT